MSHNAEFHKKYEEWKLKTKLLLENYPERKPQFHTSSGIPIDRLYLPEQAPVNYLDNIGFPGEYPYTRGLHPTMYRAKHWTMRQYAGFGSVSETNKRFRYLIEQGQTGLSVAFDLPTQIGYDSNHPLAKGEVGKVGVAIDSLEDMEELFQEISLEQVSTSMTINAPAAILFAMYLVVAEKQGIRVDKLSGTIQNDILKEYIARGTYIFPPQPSMRLITNTFEYCAKHVPRWHPISISGYHIREAGATAAQELAFTLANGIAYVDAAKKAGLAVDEFAPRLAFFFNAHNYFFEEIAKFRAARRLWSTIMKERYAAKNQRSIQLRFHTQTGGSTLTAQQPDNNIVRVTIQAMAAILGGTQSLHTNSRDEALALPSEESARIALRTQQILAHETGLADTVDPLGGSYFVERLTDVMEEQTLKYIDHIDRIGGAVSAIEQGYMQNEIHQSAYETQKAIEAGEEIIVGLNAFKSEESNQDELLRVDSSIREQQIKKLASLKSKRNNHDVQTNLKELRRVAMSTENLLPVIIKCVKSYCTVGEICDVLREVFGEYAGV